MFATAVIQILSANTLVATPNDGGIHITQRTVKGSGGGALGGGLGTEPPARGVRGGIDFFDQ